MSSRTKKVSYSQDLVGNAGLEPLADRGKMRSIFVRLEAESEGERKRNEDGVHHDSSPAFPAEARCSPLGEREIW